MKGGGGECPEHALEGVSAECKKVFVGRLSLSRR